MSNTFRATLALLVLNLSFTPAAFAQSHTLVSHPVRAAAAEEESVRALTEQYGRALAAGDLVALRKLWNPQSPNLPAQLRYYKNIFAQTRIETLNPEITRLEVTGDKALSQLTIDERRLDKKTGAVWLTFDPLRGACRSFEWVKTDSGWLIEREVLVQDELAAKLEAVPSDQERDAILAKEKRFVNNTLLGSLGNKVLRHQMRAEYDIALRYAQMQKLVAERLGDQAGVAGAWNNIAIVRHGQEEHEAGLVAAHKSLAVYESIGMKRGVALVQDNLSNLYRALGDHRRAFEFAQKSLRNAEEEHHRRGIMVALTEFGIIYGQQNNFEQALAYQERALAIAEDLGDTLMIATIRHDVALQYKAFGDYPRALEIYQQLLKQVETFGDKGGAAMVRDQIGRIYAEQGRYEEALSYHREALAGLEATNKRRATVVTLNNISAVYLAQKNYAEALSVSQRAVSLAPEVARNVDLSVALANLGYAQFGLNQLAGAQQSFAQAVAIVESLRTQTAGGVEERQRYFEEGLQAHHGLLGVLVKLNQPREALMFAERAKARALLDMLQQERVRVEKSMTAKEQDEERRLKSELTRLNKQLARAAQSDKPDRVAEVEAQLEKARLNYEAFQNTLYAAHPELKHNVAKRRSSTRRNSPSCCPTLRRCCSSTLSPRRRRISSPSRGRLNSPTLVSMFTRYQSREPSW